MKTGTMPVETFPALHDQDRYEEFLGTIKETFASAVTDGPATSETKKLHLFRTDATWLFDLFLSKLPKAVRQHYTCSACRKFVDGYGHLVVIDAEGRTIPAFWNPLTAPDLYAEAVNAVYNAVCTASVTGTFVTEQGVWGLPVTGAWHHMAAVPPEKILVPRSAKLNAGQLMAEKEEEFGMLVRSLVDFPKATVARIIPILEGEAVARSEKFLGLAKWLMNLHMVKDAHKDRKRWTNLLWLAVADAPAGWCHVRTSVLGTMLEDAQNGVPFESLKRKFNEKVHPLAYQRPTEAPTEGNIKVAEKIIEKLGLQRSLERRFARLSDVPMLWVPVPPPVTSKGGGVFGHLKPRGKAEEMPSYDGSIPAREITFCKFRDTVLPAAEKIEFLVPITGSYVALTTAVHPDAPPIMQWDRPEARNPVAWYVYPTGSLSVNWGLVPRTWAEATGLSLFPHQWGTDTDGISFAQHPKGAILFLKGCMDKNKGGNALFPELLKGDLREVRSTIEAYSQTAELYGREEGDACGLDLRKWGHEVRVTASGSTLRYRIDRWD